MRQARVHGRRGLWRVWHRRLPVTSVPQTLLDYAATATRRRLRRAWAEAEYQRRVKLPEVEAIAAAGRAGSAKLREAIAVHQPRLAHTRSLLEELFLELCEGNELPLPSLNVTVEGFLLDALWRAQRLVVEVDGGGRHDADANRTRPRTGSRPQARRLPRHLYSWR